MARRFTIHPAARDEVAEIHGDLAALSVYALVDQCRSYKVYAPVASDCDGNEIVLCGESRSFFDDQIIEEA